MPIFSFLAFFFTGPFVTRAIRPLFRKESFLVYFFVEVNFKLEYTANGAVIVADRVVRAQKGCR